MIVVPSDRMSVGDGVSFYKDLIRGWGLEVGGAQEFVESAGLGKSLIVSVGVQVLVR